MSKPSPPPPPDYQALAQQQGAANRETALAEWRLNNANQVGPWGTRTTTQTGPGDTDYTVTTTLNPQDQARLDQQRTLMSNLLGIAPTALNSVAASLGQGINPGNLPPMSYGVDTSGQQMLDFSNLPTAAFGVQGGPIQSSLDFSRAPGLQDPTAIRNQVSDAAYNQFASRFEPQATQAQQQLNTRIANMGGVSDSDAARRMTAQLLTSQGDQRRQASFDAFLKGGSEANNVFGQQLQARQQAVGELGQQGQFYNAAQNQQYGQGQQNAALRNSALQLTASLLGQQNQQNNATVQQQIQNAFANANLANSTRGQGLQEIASLRQMPLNELMAMLSGTQVQNPQFQQNIPTQIQPAPIFQAGQAGWQAANQNYANQSGQNNALMSGLTSIGTAAMPFMFSDARLKSNVVRVGTHPLGVGVYEYDIFGQRERGVMAHEVVSVRPSAVSVHPSGYLMVNYADLAAV